MDQKKVQKEIIGIVKKEFPFSSKKEFLRFSQEGENLEKAKNDRDLFLRIEQWLATLHNSHTKLGGHPFKRWFGPEEYSVSIKNEKFILRQGTKALGEIQTINGETPSDVFRFHRSRIGGSHHFRTNQALKFLLCAQTSKKAKIILFHPRKTQTLLLHRRRIQGKSVTERFQRRWHKGSAFVVIPSFANNDTVKSELQKTILWLQRHAPKMVTIDVRQNRGGSGNIAAWFAGHFFQKTVSFGGVRERVSPSSFRLRSRALLVQPQKPFINTKLILRTSIETFSTAEYFAAGLKDNHRATVVGETTGGGSGNPKKFDLWFGKQKFELFVSTWLYFRPNGELLEGKGIAPDHDSYY